MVATHAFSVLVWTPARSDRGWTRGMPPPQAPSRTVATRRTPRATLSETPPAAAAAPSPPPSADDEEQTVASYVRESSVHTAASAALQGLFSTLEARTDSADGSRPRRELLSRARDQTVSVHAGERVRSTKQTRAILDAVQTPIVQSSTFAFRSTRDCIDYNRGRYESFEYGRYGNPTARTAEEKIMALDHAEDCLLSSSGMNAVTTMLMALVPENGHIVVTTDCYRRTRQFVNTLLRKMGVTTTVLDPADMDGLKTVLETKGASMYFSESPTNPMIRVVDVPRISALCRKHGAISVFDTTFATPVNFRPMDFGADLVLHSGTKYLAGHHDVLSGALAGRADLIADVRKLHGVLGGVVDPHAAYLINRGLKTLGVRMDAHNKNAMTIARYLSTHPKISHVHYPTLKSHPDYAVASALFEKGFGGVLSFDIAGNGDKWSQETFEATGRFIDALRIPYIGPSLGGCESIVEQVCIMGYFDQPLRERKRLGIHNGLVRFSAGIEDTNDLIDDIEAALKEV